jgi:hypothetical protein
VNLTEGSKVAVPETQLAKAAPNKEY